MALLDPSCILSLLALPYAAKIYTDVSSIPSVNVLQEVYGSSDRVSKPGNIISKLGFHRLLLIRQLLSAAFASKSIATRILPPAPGRHKESQEECHAASQLVVWPEKLFKASMNIRYKADKDAVASNETRSVAAQVNVRRNDAAAVAAHDLHGDAGAALQAAADVAAVPGEAERDLRINTWGTVSRYPLLSAC